MVLQQDPPFCGICEVEAALAAAEAAEVDEDLLRSLTHLSSD